MNLYRITKTNNFNLRKEKPFKLEKEIQLLVENNLPELMGLEMVKSEFVIRGKHIDTLRKIHESEFKQFIKSRVKFNQHIFQTILT